MKSTSWEACNDEYRKTYEEAYKMKVKIRYLQEDEEKPEAIIWVDERIYVDGYRKDTIDVEYTDFLNKVIQFYVATKKTVSSLVSLTIDGDSFDLHVNGKELTVLLKSKTGKALFGDGRFYEKIESGQTLEIRHISTGTIMTLEFE